MVTMRELTNNKTDRCCNSEDWISKSMRECISQLNFFFFCYSFFTNGKNDYPVRREIDSKNRNKSSVI